MYDDHSWARQRGDTRTGNDPVPLRSAVNLDSIENVSIAILVQRVERVAESRMREICAALAVAVDCTG